MANLLSYNSDKNLKAMMVEEMKIHQKQDDLIKGTYSKINGDFKGCAVGCGVRSLNVKLGKEIKYNYHAVYALELGLPEWLARLEDIIFEFIKVDLDKKLLDLKEEFSKKLKGKIDGTEVALSIASGDGKEHMALISALLNQPVGIRFTALTKNGIVMM